MTEPEHFGHGASYIVLSCMLTGVWIGVLMAWGALAALGSHPLRALVQGVCTAAMIYVLRWRLRKDWHLVKPQPEDDI